MKRKNFISSAMTIVVGVFLLLDGVKEAKAEIRLTDSFSVTGFVRYELSLSTARRNHANVFWTDNNDINFSRLWFQTEWDYRPTETFRVFSKIRMLWDQTQSWDSALEPSYNALPIDVPENDWTMMKVSGRDARAEVWELFADINVGDLWLRLGKQQIVWGEMIGSRIMDIVNPLDMSLNQRFEPEEFENIRVPNWSIRARYDFGNLGGMIKDFIVEGFVNPGDVLPTQNAELGSPMNLQPPLPPFFRVTDKDRRGDTEYGFRVGGMIGEVYILLNYLKVFADSSRLVVRGFTPDPIFGIPIFAPRDFTRFAVLLDAEYRGMDVYGINVNYFIAPLNWVATFEGTWTPNFPYYDSSAPFGLAIRTQGTWNCALRIDWPVRVFPTHFFHANFMMVQPQLNWTQREGDHDRILTSGGAKVDNSDGSISLKLGNRFLHNDINVGVLYVYDLDNAYYVKPSIQYTLNTEIYFDLYAVFLGGSEKRPGGRFGEFDWASQVVGRVTYQF